MFKAKNKRIIAIVLSFAMVFGNISLAVAVETDYGERLHVAWETAATMAATSTSIQPAASTYPAPDAEVIADGAFPDREMAGAEWRVYSDGTVVVDSGSVSWSWVSWSTLATPTERI